MPVRKVFVYGGLVTSRNQSMLQEGECTKATDAYYKPGDIALWKRKGSSAFGSVTGQPSGLRFLGFDDADDILVAANGTTVDYAVAAHTGTFAALITGLSSTVSTFDTTHYNDVHFTHNGVDRNRAIESDLTVRLHGMLANTTAPTADATGGTGITLSSGNTLEYWVEERVKDADGNIIKRNATTLTVTVTGPVTNKDIVITRPDVVNSDATHWALYGTATNDTFPTGAEIDEVVIATTTITDTRSGTNPDLPTGEEYEVVSVEVAGIVQNLSKWGPPPSASTGDVMEDSLVTNDIDNPSHLRYSFPDEPHAFPAVNFIRFETKEQDSVTCIRSLSTFLIVSLNDTLWRVDTLPRPEDSAFQTERVKAQIQGAHGCTGPTAACLFSAGGSVRMAYISRYGLLQTDGHSWETLTDDLDWEATFTIESLRRATLLNNPRYFRLEMYASTSSGLQAYYFHYHPTVVKEGGKLAVSGPISIGASAATVAKLNSVDEVFTLRSDGTVYRENYGSADDASWHVESAQVYPADFGETIKLKRSWVHLKDGTVGQEVTSRFVMSNEGQDDVTLDAPIVYQRDEGISQYRQGYGDAFRLGCLNSDDDGTIAVNFFALEFEPQGPVAP